MFAPLVRSSQRKLLKGRARTSPAPAQLPADELNRLPPTGRRVLLTTAVSPSLQAWADVTSGWALAESGKVAGGLARMRHGLEAIRALGSEDFKTYFLGLLAATLAKAGEHSAALEVVTEALGVVERSGERFYAAELHRQRGELLLATGHDLADAVRCFESTLEIARHQRAWALERRVLRALDSTGSRTG